MLFQQYPFGMSPLMTKKGKNIGFSSFGQSQELESVTVLYLCQENKYTKVYLSSPTSKIERVTIMENERRDQRICYVRVDEEWWVVCVLQVSKDSEQVHVNFLHPSRAFKYPARPDILTIPVGDVLTRVDLGTAKGRTYALTQRET